MFVETPNLPQSPVKAVIVGEKYSILSEPLANLGITPIYVPNSQILSEYENSHADMLVCHLKGRELALCGEIYDSFVSKYTDFGFLFVQGSAHTGNEYPSDVSYNLLVFGNRYIGRGDVADSELVKHLNRHGFEECRVRQGYAKCSVCIVTESAVITADSGIATALAATGTEVLKISAGGIDLPGCNYGFIGGASGKISKHKLAFTGRLDNHPDIEQILRFLEIHGVEPVWLTDLPCFDVGSILPVIETGK